MKLAGIRWICSLTTAAASAALTSSCSTPTHDSSASAPPTTRLVNASSGRITQIEFGRQAAFARCMPLACPAITAKTLEAKAAPETPLPIDTVSSLTKAEAVTTRAGAATPMEPTASKANATRNEPLARQVVVHFAFGSATLTPTARALIDEMAKPLASARRIAISGRTDSVGPQQSNQLLATARAAVVRDHLRARYPHLAPVVTLEAQGRCCFAASNETRQGRAQNRRVEVVFERDVENL